MPSSRPAIQQVIDMTEFIRNSTTKLHMHMELHMSVRNSSPTNCRHPKHISQVFPKRSIARKSEVNVNQLKGNYNAIMPVQRAALPESVVVTVTGLALLTPVDCTKQPGSLKVPPRGTCIVNVKQFLKR